jgi:hypothetical protein
LISFKDANVACFVLNRSRGGAGLVLQSDVILSRVFDLEIDGENVRRRCVAVWRDQCRLGVSFDIERIERDDKGMMEAEVRRQPQVLDKEQSLDHLVSVLRFVALANVYKAAVLSRADAASSALEKLTTSSRYKSSRG